MILGSFYFRHTSSGNLVGEFMNQLSERAATESADFRREMINGNMEYQSTWFDISGGKMRLEISPKPGSHNIFRFVWSEGNTQQFIGEAFLSDGIYIGVYWDGFLDEKLNGLLEKK
ncbi:MAG: hypothetical protein EOO45_11240 [Flavobacterium sp.]|nr:MAG: hypothetical protein EOO45_11240 [Flavobacterium sp.]